MSLNRAREGVVFCVSLIASIIIIETTLESSPSEVHQQSYRLGKDVFASLPEPIPSSNFDGIITNVIDGDTLDIRTDDGRLITIRLVLVDAPERNELGHNEARDFVSQNCLDKPATVDPDNNQDLTYGRLVALVYCNGININEATIASGFADIYESFCGISEFGTSEWAQKYGCAGYIDLPNSGVPEDTDTDSDDDGEKMKEDCDSAYSGICISSPPPDLDCGDIPDKNFKVKPPDPHNFDGDSNGIGCET